MGSGSSLMVGSEDTRTPNRDWLLQRGGLMTRSVIVEENSVDGGNTGERTTLLRSGLVLGKITATGSDQGKYKQCDESASDGTEGAMVILASKVDMLDKEGSTGDRPATGYFGPCFVDGAKCFCTNGSGTATTLSACSTSLTALRGDGMVFKGDA